MDRARDGPGSSPPHRIGRVRFEIDGQDEAVLLKLRAEIAGGAESWVPEALDAAFGSFDEPGRTIRMERLEIDLGLLPKGGLTPERLSEAVRTALAERLATPDLAASTPPRASTEHRTLAEAFHAFLETGRLPWWSPAASLLALEAEIRRMSRPRLRELARVSAPALRQTRGAHRLVLQVEEKAAAAVAAALPGAREARIRETPWRPGVVPDSPELEEMVARVRMAATAGAETGERSEPRETVPRSEVSDRPAAEEEVSGRAEPEPDLSIDAVIPVADAGLVLVHPFLQALFEARGLATGGRFASEAEQIRAIYLVACLAAGDAARSEPELVLPKLLCGWPLEEPVPRASALAPGDREESEALLRDIIGHWTALGRASPEALRETFLTRRGRLADAPNAWRLEIEQRGTDVLLGQLPWALSPLRLPWMARPIFVDWT